MNTIQEIFFHERSIEMNSTSNFKFIELSKVILENLQYLPLLQLYSPFQLVVLDERLPL